MYYKGENKIIYQDSEITKFLVESKKYGEFEVIIDTKNYDKIKDYRWYVNYSKKNKKFTNIAAVKNNNIHILLHQLIMNDKWIDHNNGDIFDNRESNLRKCTNQQNMCNRGLQKNNTSGYKGVTWREKIKKWQCRISINNKRICLGYFIDLKEAALTYNQAAIKYHSKFARLNQI
ncbi:MAG: hypothetical protein JXN64_06270 [Spirochaetes bacterium]|nr:hypothetical protein [Spirochaetota bacterium]